MTAGPFDSQITFCYTRDLATTAAFYEDVLGLTMVLDQGGCRIYRVADEAYLGFCERESAGAPQGVILTLVTEDVDGWHERMREVGVEFEKAPTMNPDYHIYHCFLRDPNGYLIEIQRFEDPRWPSPR
jgi:catechol 2,3-dioxygenase-like lactoylglutathione lyase family enzyme